MSLRRNKPLKPGKPLRSRSTLKRGKRLRQQSAKRAAEQPLRAAVTAEVIARDGQCIARLRGAPTACYGPLVAHEVVKRSQKRGGHLDPANCLAVCWGHNGWIEDEPKAAKALGLVRSRWEDDSDDA